MSCKVVAIVGYRNYENYDELSKTVKEIFKREKITPLKIITGECRGTDQTVWEFARQNIYPLQIFTADLKKYGSPYAFHKRNKDIVREADLVIAFVSKYSKGTVYTINYAKRCGKPLFEIKIQAPPPIARKRKREFN